MTKLLKKAFKAAGNLPAAQQDTLAVRVLHAVEIIKDEIRWNAAFARSPEILERLADEALADLRVGNVTPLDLDIVKKSTP